MVRDIEEKSPFFTYAKVKSGMPKEHGLVWHTISIVLYCWGRKCDTRQKRNEVEKEDKTSSLRAMYVFS